jgi:hypothetical protein
MPHDINGIGEPMVPVGAGVNEVLESAQNVEVPLRQLREAGATTDCHLAGAMRLVQPVSEEELLPSCLRLISRCAATGLLIGLKCLEGLDAGVEGAVLA